MTAKIWLEAFFRSLEELKNESDIEKAADWTNFMMKVMRITASKVACRLVGKDFKCALDSGEYLSIDAMLLDQAKYPEGWNKGDWDPFILPSAVIELENVWDKEKVAYDLWKIICIRAPLRVLICYQRDREEIDLLRKKLEDVIIRHQLMRKEIGELLVIMGDDEAGIREWKPLGSRNWRKYFNVFNWDGSKFERIDA